MYNYLIKRILDLVFALTVFIFFSPLFIVITVVLYFVNKGKPFFIQSRPGKNGKIFKLVKFKTMDDKKDIYGELLHDSLRLTKIGKVIRFLSLDELPQFLNIIKGDMSLIGPRPLLIEYLPLYNNFQSRRHEVRPGLTGWAQVRGRKGITFSRRFEMDVWYVDNISFLLDIKIFFMTIGMTLMLKNNPPGKLKIDVDDVEFRKRLGIETSKVS
jgi:undecaprenyl phosphate N,N'-diacetylbacillosamine 1-phosphate transferase